MLDRLFCYGTLCLPEIMQQVIRRKTSGVKAELQDYACYLVKGRHYPAAAPAAGSTLTGLLYSGLSARELALLDHYEGLEYRRLRVSVTTHDGKQAQAWVYVLRPHHSSRLTEKTWSLEEFVKTQAENYKKALGAGGVFRHPVQSEKINH